MWSVLKKSRLSDFFEAASKLRWSGELSVLKLLLSNTITITSQTTTSHTTTPHKYLSRIYHNININMISLRTAARSAPRFLARTARPATRTTTLFSTQSARVVRQTSAFSTTVFRRAAAGEVDEELSAKLASEIEYENDVKENEPLPASIKDFLENGPFEIQDTPGKEEVTLTRTFGNEKYVHPLSTCS
jgi:hypothetical protein